ncbi:MAG: proprotein convertase P-domain-containing protein, partial [Deltaproteobacteria bacterium]|nr:proprotein convertase P-domain-containing protein [Deltaproteobacteria bacterium]
MRPAALALLACISLLPARAGGDSLRATLRQNLAEVSHRVKVEINRGIATLQVRRTFANRGSRHDEAHLVIKTPPGAAATGLRIRAGKRWYDGELMRADKARAMYEKLTGMGKFRPKDPALLQWIWADELELYVFPIAPGKASTVEYTLTVPTEYQDGRYYLSYPRASDADNLVMPSFELDTAYGTEVFLDDRPVAPREPTIGSRPSPLLVDLGLESEASHVAPSLELPWAGDEPPRRVHVKADIRHTYRGDLRVQLITPAKRRITLFDRRGGGDNDVAIDKIVTIANRERGKAPGSWTLLVSDFAGKDVGMVRRWSLQLLGKPKGKRGKRIKSSSPIAIPDAPTSASGVGMHRVAITAPSISTMAARLGQVALVRAHQFTRLEVDVADKLRPLPKKAQVVFVLDLSRSLDDEEVTAQLELARGYLSHVPDAEFAVVGYARHARLLSGFTKAKKGPKLLDRLARGGALRLSNGSALEMGLRKAERVLASRPGPRRIVLLTDSLLRPSWKNQDALAQLPRGASQPLIHVVIPSSGGSGV